MISFFFSTVPYYECDTKSIEKKTKMCEIQVRHCFKQSKNK
jgi:hypothetical protein